MIRAIVFGFVLTASIDASVPELSFFKRNGVVRTMPYASSSVLLIQFQAIEGW